MRDFDVITNDGRTLAATEGGDPAGALVVYHHGTPMSRRLMADWERDAATRGIRLVGYDRPGFGGSTRHPGRRVADAAADTAAIADHLGAARFATWGLSGGGPHALACAALLPERVFAAATMGGVAPFDAAGLDFLAGMGQDNLDEFGAATRGESAIAEFLAPARAGLLAPDADLVEEMATLLPEVDVTALRAGVGAFLQEAIRTGQGPSADGWIDDDLAFVASWGFDLTALTVPVLVMQGDQDLMVPAAHGEWLAAAIPGAEQWRMPDEGHLSLLPMAGEVHAWLLEHAG